MGSLGQPLVSDPSRDSGRSGTAAAMFEDKCDPIHALQLDNISSMNVWLSIGACAYASVSFVLLLINFMQCKKDYYDIFSQGCPDPEALIVSGDAVHRIEFTSAFFFNCINLLIVAYSSNKAKFENPSLFKTWAFMNLLFSSTAMILVWANRPLFEVPAHQMEYLSEISMTFLETQLLSHGIQNLKSGFSKRIAQIINWVPSLLAIFQLFVFNFGGVLADVPNWKGECSFLGYHAQRLVGNTSCSGYGDAGGEWYAHCIEYVVGFLNAMQAFFISLDNKIDADNELQSIMRLFQDQGAVGISKDTKIRQLEQKLKELEASQP